MDECEFELTEQGLARGLSALTDLASALTYAVEVLNSARLRESTEPMDFYEQVRMYEIALIKRALRQCKGNQSQAARLLKLKQTTLHGKIKLYGIFPSTLLYANSPKSEESLSNSTF
jgi:DNA-binding NtrC family response regulator